ncbi:LysR family transcriptional regulator [Bosea sp. (in: a-proteobacteria)]|uniref:LysR family transcriptional regulator n=1 Tax=Bosea sp. (in: a-proteobacteria) TaxID=1871050 RepID=UPI0026194A3E|nr:LysR family transcriptional regulator [Bosea sp. (in: a-proteobacteria)]MCO5089949.1 LysR family transcriptional regulator [Bosea sp. (in: a-proteobacteria)]
MPPRSDTSRDGSLADFAAENDEAPDTDPLCGDEAGYPGLVRTASKGASLRNFNLNLLPILEALLAEQNLSRAAQKLGMSQSAVSHALAKLRSQFQDPLFVRSRYGIEPTAKALRLRAPVASALGVIRREIVSPEHAGETAIGPRFQCGVTEPLDEGPALVSATMEALREISAETALTFRAVGGSDWKKMLRLRYLDIVFDAKPAPDSDLESEFVKDRHYNCYVRSDSAIAAADFTIDRYLKMSHVILDTPTADSRSTLRQALAARNGSRTIGARVHTHFHAALVASQSDHVGTGYREDIALYARNLPLRVLDCPVPAEPSPLFMTWLRTRTNETAHKRIRQRLTQLYRQEGLPEARDTRQAPPASR